MVERHYGLDWLRIGAFALLILYHTGMYYVEWDFHLKARPTVDWVRWPMLAVNPWRMALLFLVSGIATRFMMAKAEGPGALWRARWPRLLLPLLFGILVVVPLQPWIELVTKHGYPHGFGHFLAHDYFRFGALDGILLPTWNHLWFLAYLLVYTLALVVLSAVAPGWPAVLLRALSGWRLWLLPILWLLAARVLLLPRFGETHALVDDWFLHAAYLPVFLFGFVAGDSPALKARLAGAWRPLLAVAVAALLVRFLGYAGWAVSFEQMPPAVGVATEVARAVQIWATLAGLTGFALARLNRDHPWRPLLVRAVFPAYIVHQTAIIGLAWWTAPFAWPQWAQAGVILSGTLLACLAAWALAERLGPAGVLLGVKPEPARRMGVA
jgi:hypothetical protein